MVHIIWLSPLFLTRLLGYFLNFSIPTLKSNEPLKAATGAHNAILGRQHRGASDRPIMQIRSLVITSFTFISRVCNQISINWVKVRLCKIDFGFNLVGFHTQVREFDTTLLKGLICFQFKQKTLLWNIKLQELLTKNKGQKALRS